MFKHAAHTLYTCVKPWKIELKVRGKFFRFEPVLNPKRTGPAVGFGVRKISRTEPKVGFEVQIFWKRTGPNRTSATLGLHSDFGLGEWEREHLARLYEYFCSRSLIFVHTHFRDLVPYGSQQTVVAVQIDRSVDRRTRHLYLISIHSVS